jgi:hypothetical protein
MKYEAEVLINVVCVRERENNRRMENYIIRRFMI